MKKEDQPNCIIVDTYETPRPLTRLEIESLKQDMKESAKLMRRLISQRAQLLKLRKEI